MSTSAPSGEISEGKALSYDAVVKQFSALESKLDGIMSFVKEVNTKLEQQDIARKRASLLAQKVALRKASSKKREEAFAVRSEEEEESKKKEEAKRKKLEELKSRLQEVKSKVEEERKMREASAKQPAVTGKGNVGAVAEENDSLAQIGASPETQAYWKEIVGASDKFKSLGLLSG